MEVKKHYYRWEDINEMCMKIFSQIYKDDWRPDYIVGLTRGGNIPATILSHMMEVPAEALKISLRDHASTETNAWMAEDAYNGKNILVVDDINDTGETLSHLCNDWQNSCLQDDKVKWENIFGGNVRFATLTENLASDFDKVSYYVHEVNKAEEDVWLVYPWEI